MMVSDAVFHLVSMQAKNERDAADARERASRGSKAGRVRWVAVAANHEAQAVALGMAVSALVDLPL